MSRFLCDRLAAFSEYVPGEQPKDQKYIKLNTNESPYAPPKNVVDAVNGKEIEKLRLYSDPECTALKNELAKNFKVRPEKVFVSNGSDEILNFAFMAYSQNGVSFNDLTYGFYAVLADLYGVKPNIVPLNEDFTIPVSKFFGRNQLVVVVNPNAPTGLALSKEDIEKIVSSCSGVVIVDEAYVDFGTESSVDLIDKYDNLLVVQTFSKSRSMAGARLGMAFADEALIKDLEKIKFSTNPYNVNRLTQIAGVAALKSQEYFDANCRKIADTREYIKKELEKRGFYVTDSKSNFLFAKNEQLEGGTFYLALKEKGVLVRHFGTERIKDFVRITVGSREEMDIFLEKTDEILKEIN